MSSVWSNSLIGKFLSINLKSENLKERRKLNYSPFNWLFALSSFKFLTCSFVFIFAHFVLLNIVMVLLFGHHHENYDLVTQKKLFSCAVTEECCNKKSTVVRSSSKKQKPNLTLESSHETKSYNLKGGHNIDSNWTQNNDGIFGLPRFICFLTFCSILVIPVTIFNWFKEHSGVYRVYNSYYAKIWVSLSIKILLWNIKYDMNGKHKNLIFHNHITTSSSSTIEEDKTLSNPFSITFNPLVGSALTFKNEKKQSSKLAQNIPITLPASMTTRKPTNLTTRA